MNRDLLAAMRAVASADKFSGCIGGFARWLIQYAAHCAPPSLSDRLEEEWLADLAARPGRVSRLSLAFGCCWATRVITHEHAATNVQAAGSATGHATMTTYAQHDSWHLSRRSTALLLIASVHAVLIYLFANGLVRGIIQVMPQVTHATVLTEPQPRQIPPPPPPGPRLASTRVEVPQPTLTFEVPSNDDAVGDVIPSKSQSPPPPAKVANRVVGGPGVGFPHTHDYYPAAAIRLGEKGVATVRVCVDGNGRLTSDPTVAQSSGSPRLDEGSVRLAKAGSGHYRPTTEDGRPVSSCYPVRIRFDFMN
jgi:TonB family protein